MKTHARVVVIGGGVTGCSVLYHLASAGWTDCLLLERSELTSGSTWHAAGGTAALAASATMTRLHRYSFELYPKLEAQTGQSCGFHHVGGVLLGVYESPCTHWSVDGTPQDFGHELLPDDLARMEHNMAQAVRSVPVLGRAGIRRVVNGPMIFSPDLNPLVGPLPGLRNYWCACGVMTAFSQAGAVGKVLTEWMTNGDPGLDFFVWDVIRYGNWAGREPAERLVLFEIDTVDADPWGGEPVLRDGEYVGYLTSAGYGHCAGMTLALGYARSDAIASNAAYDVEVMGRPRPARRLERPAIDPEGRRMRG